MNKKNSWNLINSVLICLLIIAIVFIKQQKNDRIIFIDNVKVFKGFNMTKELGDMNEVKFKPELEAYDSLVSTLSIIESKLKLKGDKASKEETKEYVSLRRKISNKENEIEEIKMYVKNDINRKVWERLNVYIKEFGEKNNVKLIIGAQGNGNIMYGNSKVDFTEKFINYANFKYEGN